MNIANNVLQIIFINIATYIVLINFIKQKNNAKRFSVIVAISVSEGIIASYLIIHFKIFPIMLITYLAYGICVGIIIKKNLKYSSFITLISLTVAYLFYILSIVLAAIILKGIDNTIQRDNIMILILGFFIEVILLSLIFKIKRFKNGIPFLQNEQKVGNIGVIGIVFIGIALIVYSFIQDTVHTKYIFFGMIIELICFFIWLKRKITVYYRQRLKERTVEELESEIRARDERICEVVDENSRLAEVNHKFSSRIRALEDFSCKMIERPEIAELMRCEFGNEFADFEEAVKNVSEEFYSEMKHAVIIRKNLPKTGVFGVDNLLEYMCKESAKNGIDFDVKINGNILFMVQKIIDSKMLETLLGDHIKDAIIAINSSQNTYKNILVTIGIVKECYEISIYDTGIEFEIDTLLKLGLERITTHKSTGGSGIGFMTTFETLAKTKASLIIEEKHPITNNDYTKIVRIRFDGKKEYRIKSYRQNEIEGRKVDKRIKFEKT